MVPESMIDRPAGRLSAAARLAAMSSRRSPHLPPVWLMALALVAVAANLRTAMASVPPLTESIADDLGLSNTALGALTTLPVLCMGLFAPFAQRIAARLGAAASVELSIACVAVGLGAPVRRRRDVAACMPGRSSPGSASPSAARSSRAWSRSSSRPSAPGWSPVSTCWR